MNLKNKKNIILPFQLGSTAQSGAPVGGLLSNGEPTHLGFLAIAVPSFFTYHYIVHPVLCTTTSPRQIWGGGASGGWAPLKCFLVPPHPWVFTNLVKEKVSSDDQDQSLSMISKEKKILAEDHALRTVLPRITMLMRIFLTVPVTTCSAEPSFSCLRRLKNYMWSTMEQERLSSLAFLSIEKEISINIDEIIDEFASTNPRRLKLLYW